MRIFLITSTVLILSLWLLISLFCLGIIDIPFIALKRPETMSGLGDSMGLLNGLFSAITVILALVAIVYQSKELKDATEAQNQQAQALSEQLGYQQKITQIQVEQASALTQQLEQQQISNKIVALATRQNFIISEASRLSDVIDSLYGKFEKEELFNNCVNKRKSLMDEAKEIDEEMKQLLDKV